MSIRLLVAIATIAIVAGAALACGMRAPVRASRPNVLLISIDTLRADRVGSYGYAAAATPSLDALARRGLRFTRAATVTPLTLPAHASLMTGTFPGFHAVRDNAGFVLDDEQTTLAEMFQAAGYRTGAFVAAFVLDRRGGLDQGFDRYADDFDLSKYQSGVAAEDVERPGRDVVDKAIAWLDEDRGRPFFAWVHLYEPHAPYDAPAAMRARFPPTLDGAYDAEVAAADVEIGRLVTHLSSSGRLDATVVVAVADHGESLGAHDEREHGFFVYDATVRIPLVIAGPGVAAREIADQVRIVDVMPTVLEVAGVAVPPAVQGRSLVPLANGDRLNLVSLSESWYPRRHFGWSELTSIDDGRYKLVAAPRRELYDTANDPGETHDLAASNAARADALERALRDLLAATSSSKPAAAPRPVAPEVEERLRALGYVAGGVSGTPSDRPRGDPKDKIALYNLLKLAAEDATAGRVPDAIAKVRRALASDPDIVEGHRLLGRFYRRNGQIADAIAAYQKALALDPDNQGTSVEWPLAGLWIERGEWANAEAVLTHALTGPVDRPPFLARLGEVHVALKRFDEAERELREALQANPALTRAHYHLGLIYEARRDPARAVAEYEAELSRDASFAPAYLYLAKARLTLGDLAAAEGAARKGLMLSPDPRIAPLGHYVLADVYNRLGRPEDAAREAAAGRRLEQKGRK